MNVLLCRTPFLKLEGHTKGLFSCDWSPAFKVIVSGGIDKTIGVFNPFSGKRQATITGHTAPVSHVLLNDQDRQIISLGAVCLPFSRKKKAGFDVADDAESP